MAYPERKVVICEQASSEKNLTSASSSFSSRSTTGSTSDLAVLGGQRDGTTMRRGREGEREG